MRSLGRTGQSNLDNTRPDLSENDENVLRAGQEHRWSIVLGNKPAKPPDLDVLVHNPAQEEAGS